MSSQEAFDSNTKFHPFWWEDAPPPPRSGGVVPASADVVVIGAGYTGLTAAMTIARAGRRVLVLDAQAAGGGASSRNGGQVGSGNQKCTVAELMRRFGEAKSRALLAEGMEMVRHLEAFVEAEQIHCHFTRVGRFRGAIAPAHYEAMARDLESMQRLCGVEFFMVPKEEQHKEVGTDAYFGGAVLPDDAAVHPALLQRGLLRCAESAGVEIFSHTLALDIEHRADGLSVRTHRGSIAAAAVVVATNGYSGAALPELARRIIPVGSAILATEELAPETMNRLMPKGRVVGNTARVLHYYRTSPDARRLLFGGRLGKIGAPQDVRAYRHLHREMLQVFPELAAVKITHCWDGYVGFTRNVFPFLGVRNGVYYAAGYCGTGVSRAVYFGHKIALQLLGRPEGATAFDSLASPGFPFASVVRRAVSLGTAWKRFQDWSDRRR